MPRYRLTIEYDGRPFCGWQRQAADLSIQQVLEEAIARFSGESPVTQAAGRTDAGVHALGQVVHFDLEREWDPRKIREALNFHLKPHPVAVIEAEAVGAQLPHQAAPRGDPYRRARRRGVRGPFLGDGAALRVSHPQPPRPRRAG